MSWISLIGRAGTVLLMIGLALGLVSLMPAAPMSWSYSSSSQDAPPEKYTSLSITSVITPQTGLLITMNASNEVYVYVLDVFENDLRDWSASWVREHFPDIDESALWWESRNLTVLDAFLESQSDVVVWKSDLFTKLSHEVFPAKVSNATVLVANPSHNSVQFGYEIKSITSLAPRERTFTTAQLLVLVGVILTVPWIFFTRIRRTPMQ